MFIGVPISYDNTNSVFVPVKILLGNQLGMYVHCFEPLASP